MPVWAKLTPSTTEIVEEARRGVSRRRRCDRVVEHVPVAAADRSGDARLRNERRRPGLERRPWRPGDPSAIAREDVAADQRVSRPGVLRHRRHQHLRARAQLHAARLRHGAGLHRGDARSRDRPDRDQEPDRRHAAVHGEARLRVDSRISAASAAATSSCTRRFGGPKARSTTAATTPKGMRVESGRQAIRPAGRQAGLRRADRRRLVESALESRTSRRRRSRAGPGPRITSPRCGSA